MLKNGKSENLASMKIEAAQGEPQYCLEWREVQKILVEGFP